MGSQAPDPWLSDLVSLVKRNEASLPTSLFIACEAINEIINSDNDDVVPYLKVAIAALQEAHGGLDPLKGDIKEGSGVVSTPFQRRRASDILKAIECKLEAMKVSRYSSLSQATHL